MDHRRHDARRFDRGDLRPDPAPGATDTEYRAVFKTPADEGINGDTSPTVNVDVVVTCSTVIGANAGIAFPCA